MTLTEIFSNPYLSSRAIKAIEDSLRDYQDQPDKRKDFAAEALKGCEAANAPISLLDELYTTAYL